MGGVPGTSKRDVSHLNPSKPHTCLQNEGVGPHDLELVSSPH